MRKQLKARLHSPFSDVKEQCNPELQRAIDENILLLRTMRLLVKDPSSSGDIQLNVRAQ